VDTQPNTWFRTENIAWGRLAFVVGLAIICWSGYVEYIPPHIYKPVTITLATIQAAVTFVMHSGTTQQ
jgi:hypothetical protein